MILPHLSVFITDVPDIVYIMWEVRMYVHVGLSGLLSVMSVVIPIHPWPEGVGGWLMCMHDVL